MFDENESSLIKVIKSRATEKVQFFYFSSPGRRGLPGRDGFEAPNLRSVLDLGVYSGSNQP